MVLKLRHKIVILAVVSALLPVVIMTGLTFIQKKNLQRLVENKIDALTVDNLKSTALDFYKTCDITNKIMVEQVSRHIDIAVDRINNEGGLSLSATQKIRWLAVNQYTRETIEISLPAMTIGGKAIEPNADFARPTPVIDILKKMTGGTYTIFERMNEKGDMLRIATNVPKADGQRAIGTYIPATDPDGKPNRVIETLMKGETYKGSAFVVDALYITAYEPVKDSSGKIIGCIYSGIKINAMTMVKDLMKNERIGKSGYIAVLGGSGESRGKYIVSLNNTREGESVLDVKDANGKYFIRDMLSAATTSPGTISYMDYPWMNPGIDKVPRHKKASCIYFAPWDWVIIPSMYMDDFNDMYNEVSSSIDGLLLSIVIGGIAFLLLAALFAFYMGNRISRPVAQISEIACSIANGDLSGAITGFKAVSKAVSGNGEIDEKLLAQDETGSLIRSIVMMTKNLNSLVGEVQKATIHLVSTATEIAASSREQEVTVNELGASTNEIVSSTKEISSTSQQLVNTMNEVAEASNNAAGLAEAGKSGLNNMEKSMEQLASATASISSKLSIINEKTSNINNVVATITKVADQTNLLSLNASIEAEKAGEYGRGFAVVAREIRRLADQTAIATLDIIKMVREMQSAVSAGVMGMDKFSEDVRQSVRETELISGQIEGIIMEVQNLPTKFDMVIDGMKQQTIGAQQISDSMTQLGECTRTTSESLRAFNEVAVQLNNATLNLQKEVAIFKVK